MDITPGIYRHYKGNEFDVLLIAKHEDTHEPLVIYRARYGDHSTWARPLSVFLESVTVDGQTVPRFTKIS